MKSVEFAGILSGSARLEPSAPTDAPCILLSVNTTPQPKGTTMTFQSNSPRLAVGRSIFEVDVQGWTSLVVAADLFAAKRAAVQDEPGASVEDVRVLKITAIPAMDHIDCGAPRCGTCYSVSPPSPENEGYSGCCNDRIEYGDEYAGDAQFLLAVATGEVTL